jgi:hypothetical protein
MVRSQEVAVVSPMELAVATFISNLPSVKIPPLLAAKVDVIGWATSLFEGTTYTDPDPNYISRELLMMTLTADTVEAVLSASEITKLQQWIGNAPGAGTGPCEISDLYITGSDFGEGLPCYMIMTVTNLDTGHQRKVTTGASGLQAQVLRLISLGSWPIRCQITRTESKDKGGRFIFRLFPVD